MLKNSLSIILLLLILLIGYSFWKKEEYIQSARILRTIEAPSQQSAFTVTKSSHKITIDLPEKIKQKLQAPDAALSIFIVPIGPTSLRLSKNYFFLAPPVQIDLPDEAQSQYYLIASYSSPTVKNLHEQDAATTITLIDQNVKRVSLRQIEEKITGDCQNVLNKYIANLQISETTKKFFDPKKKYYFALMASNQSASANILALHEINTKITGAIGIQLSFPPLKLKANDKFIYPQILECNQAENTQSCANQNLLNPIAVPHHFNILYKNLYSEHCITEKVHELQIMHYTEDDKTFFDTPSQQ